MVDVAQLNDALAANYMLVSVEIRSWSGRVTDKAAGNEIISAKGATADSGKFIKYLFASADAELDEVQQNGSLVRAFVYENTVPWSSNTEGAKRGDRLISAKKAIDFLRDLNVVKREYDASVQRLINVWSARKAQALSNLNGLGNPDDYPDESEVAALFGVSVDLRPVPVLSDFNRVNIPPELAEALGQRHAAQAMIQVDNAMGDLKARLLKELQRIATQLGKAGSGEKTRLYDSLVTNMQVLVELVRTMNVAGKPELTELADRIEKELLAHPVDVYRNDKERAAVVASKAQQLAVDAAMESVWKL